MTVKNAFINEINLNTFTFDKNFNHSLSSVGGDIQNISTTIYEVLMHNCIAKFIDHEWGIKLTPA